MATSAQSTPEPLEVALSVIPSLPRPVLARIVARAIERLDEIDGDPDAEQTGDEGEPDFSPEVARTYGSGPGCPIGDPDGGIEDMPEDDQIGPDMRPIVDREAYREHRARLQRERCFPLPKVRPTNYGYRSRVLYQEPTVPTKRQLLRRKRGLPRSPRA